jgi:phage repressor protein C with HTH and peptisase S24 domain
MATQKSQTQYMPNLFTNVEGFQGKTSVESSESFHLPGFMGDYMAFMINSDSMWPTLTNGDMALCTAIDDPTHIVDNEIYAIVTDEQSFVKRIKRCVDSTGELTHLYLISDHKQRFAAFYLETSKIQKILKVTNKISSMV